MLNEDKVILMTKMASYEARESKKCLKITSYFRGDYIAVQIVKTILAVTISFGILFGLYMVYNLEEFMANIYKIDLMSFAREVLTKYAIFLVVFVVITYLLSTWKYYKAKKSIRNYYQNLKKLDAFYKKEQ